MYGQRKPVGGPAPSRSGGQTRSPSIMADISIQDLERLDKTMVLVAFLGLIINVVQVVAISNHSWLKATALSNGQPFTAHLSLASVQFGNDTHPSKDNRFFCVSRSDECSLRQLCATNAATETYSNGMAKYTSKAAWCQASDAGAFATRLLASGLLLGLAATGVTAMYAAQSIPWVADQFDKVEELGFSDQMQKYIIAGGWGALWVFLFTSMLSYAVMIPDTLGWGTVSLEASFGLLRVCFVLASVQCALVVNSLFELWSHDSMKSVWKDFMATKLVSARKALYVLLTIQVRSAISRTRDLEHATSNTRPAPLVATAACARGRCIRTGSRGC